MGIYGRQWILPINPWRTKDILPRTEAFAKESQVEIAISPAGRQQISSRNMAKICSQFVLIAGISMLRCNKEGGRSSRQGCSHAVVPGATRNGCRGGNCQTACKPGSVPRRSDPRRMDGHSSGTPVAGRLARPTRTAARKPACPPDTRRRRPAAVPTWSCSRWGLPCRPRRRGRGALLPPRFALTGARERAGRRYVFCGTVPGVAPAGRYPAPFLRGARTFLPPVPRGRKAAIRPSGGLEVSAAAGRGQEAARRARRCSRMARHSPSATPSTLPWRKWRWKAVTTCSVRRS